MEKYKAKTHKHSFNEWQKLKKETYDIYPLGAIVALIKFVKIRKRIIILIKQQLIYILLKIKHEIITTIIQYFFLSLNPLLNLIIIKCCTVIKIEYFFLFFLL